MDDPVSRQPLPAVAGIYGNGLRLSSDDPAAEARRKVEALSPEPSTLYIIHSPLAGDGIRELAGKLPRDSWIALVELDPALAPLIAPFRQELLPGDARIWIPPSFGHTPALPSPLQDLLQPWLREIPLLFSRGMRRIRHLSFHGGRRIAPEAYRALESELDREHRRYWRNLSTLQWMAPSWIRNSLTNLARVAARPVPWPLPCHGDLIVAGAGPSLDALLPALAAMKSRPPLLAVDTALRPLQAHGITPDYLIILESQKANLPDFLGVRPGAMQIFADLGSCMDFLEGDEWPSPCFFASRFAPSQWWSLLDKVPGPRLVPQIPPLGSVGLTALWIASWLCPGRLWIAGLDFASEAGKSHVRGAPALVSRLATHGRLSGWPLTGLSPRDQALPGSSLHTDPVLASYGSDARELLSLRTSGGKLSFDLRKQGLDLGIPRREISDIPATGSLPYRHGASSGHEPVGAAIRGLLTELEENLTRGMAISREFVSDPEDGTDLSEQLAGLDFFLLSIPPHMRSGQGFAARAFVEFHRCRTQVVRSRDLIPRWS